jgi:hypothetical protein
VSSSSYDTHVSSSSYDTHVSSSYDTHVSSSSYDRPRARETRGCKSLKVTSIAYPNTWIVSLCACKKQSGVYMYPPPHISKRNNQGYPCIFLIYLHTYTYIHTRIHTHNRSSQQHLELPHLGPEYGASQTGADATVVAAVTPAVVDVTLMLGLDFAVTGPANSAQRSQFVEELTCDLANSTGTTTYCMCFTTHSITRHRRSHLLEEVA